MAQNSNVVVDHGASQWSDLWKKEDYLAIWLGFIIIAISLIAYLNYGPNAEFVEKINAADQIQAAESARAPFKTIAWYKAKDSKGKLKASGSDFGKFVSHWTKHPGSWENNPMDSLIMTGEQASAKNEKAMPKYEDAKAATQAALVLAQAAETAAADANFANETLNGEAQNKISDWREAHRAESSVKKKIENKP